MRGRRRRSSRCGGIFRTQLPHLLRPLVRCPAHQLYSISDEDIRRPVQLTVVVLRHYGESRGARRPFSVLRCPRRHFHRVVSFEVLFSVNGLITMMVQAPNEDAEAVEFVWLAAVGHGRPKPIVLDPIAVMNVAKREIRGDAM